MIFNGQVFLFAAPEAGLDKAGRRRAAAAHLLLARMDQVLRRVLPGHDPEHLLLQEPAGDVRRDDEDLLR